MGSKINYVAVFCGASSGSDETIKETCNKLADELLNSQIHLVFGGSKAGIMGIIADAMIERNMKTIGVIPESLKIKEVAHSGLNELIVVENMHQRKAIMAEKADAFIALPGGFGTFDELFEIITWNQLGIISKPVALLNFKGFFNPLLEFLKHASEKGFIKRENLDMLIIEENPKILIHKLIQASEDESRKIGYLR